MQFINASDERFACAFCGHQSNVRFARVNLCGLCESSLRACLELPDDFQRDFIIVALSLDTDVDRRNFIEAFHLMVYRVTPPRPTPSPIWKI